MERANARVVEIFNAAEIQLVNIAPAAQVIRDLQPGRLLHAGPPITVEEMPEPMAGAAIGALLWEGLARDDTEAWAMLHGGEIELRPTQDYGAVGPMAGIISPSMPVFVVRNAPFGTEAYATVNEGLGRALRFGVYDEVVLARLRWLRDCFAPLLGEALALQGPLDIKAIIQEALHRGDECHNRNKAATALFLKILAPAMVRTRRPREEIAACLEFIGGNDHFFLNLSIAHSKATADAAWVSGSTIVTAMAANGVHFGIRVAGLGNEWITAPAPHPEGRWFSGFCAADAAPMMGDSYISEVVGLGAVAMAAAPAIVSFVGGTPSQAHEYTEEMRKIAAGEHRTFTIPSMDFRGVPLGLDVRRIVETGIAPVLNTGIAARRVGVGQIGAGIQRAPLECFIKALDRIQSRSAPASSGVRPSKHGVAEVP